MKLEINRNPIAFKDIRPGHVFLRRDDIDEKYICPYIKIDKAKLLFPDQIINAVALAGITKEANKTYQFILDDEIVFDITDYSKISIDIAF